VGDLSNGHISAVTRYDWQLFTIFDVNIHVKTRTACKNDLQQQKDKVVPVLN
jgi:hypothetical protein